VLNESIVVYMLELATAVLAALLIVAPCIWRARLCWRVFGNPWRIQP
jgi:hypothetical protein